MKILFLLLALCAFLVSAQYYGRRGYYRGLGYRRRPFYGGRRFGRFGRRFGGYGRRFGGYGRRFGRFGRPFG